MSILKQVLADTLSSLIRRSSTENPTTPGGERQEIKVGGSPSNAPRQTIASRSNMKTVILNWNRGENDPFTVINRTIRQHFIACGKNVEVVEISASDSDWIAQIREMASSKIEFAYTWQGLASDTRVKIGDYEENLWDFLKVPLICIHGDHPSHMPLNHRLESPYCFHLYTNADFARYSNRHFRQVRSASVIDIPLLHREPRLERQTGDYFVIAKNVHHPIDTENQWRQTLDGPTFNAYMMAAEILKPRISREPYVEIHDVLDDLIDQQDWIFLHPDMNADAYHRFHSRLDHYMRSYKSVSAATALRDFPLRILGRGWDRVAEAAPRTHVFEPGRNMADSQDLYYTRYGIVDISPSKGLHDRTRRAMANGTAFLSSASLEDSLSDITRYDRLFFSFRTDELPAKCAAVLRDPEEHRRAAQQFARYYHDRFHFKDFVNRIELLAKLVNPFWV